jgi:hypothetical protein
MPQLIDALVRKIEVGVAPREVYDEEVRGLFLYVTKAGAVSSFGATSPLLLLERALPPAHATPARPIPRRTSTEFAATPPTRSWQHA